MKLPSITQILAELNRAFRRFPLALIGTAIGTIAAIVLVEREASPEPSIFYPILLSTILAIPLLTALRLATEREDSGSGRIWAMQGIGVALLIVYAFTVPSDLFRAPMYYLFRFFAFGIVCCLLFSFLPFARSRQSNGFWQFNRIIVYRVILAGAFALVLFMGLGLALAALDNLFGMDVPSKRYFELWILILGLFAVPFMLSGIPEKLRELGEADDYPRSLRVLGQYVLPPLVLIYFVILYAYVAKIVVTWSWPQGWVGRLILGFSATGILSLFVLDPIRDKMETLWVKKVARWYYVILLPLIVVLFLALWRRISEYGLTEDRYLGLAIGAWLALIAGYFLLSRAKSIKMIPASLCVFTFLISIGPWGMFSVSEKSQVGRLRNMLTADSILVNGAVQEAPSPVSDDHDLQISSILAYLHEIHGFSAIQPWFAESLRSDSAEGWNRYKSASYVAGLLGVEYNPRGMPGRDEYFFVFADLQAPISISGYDDMVQADFGNREARSRRIDAPLAGEVETTADSVIVRIMSDTARADSIVIPLRPLIERIVSTHSRADGQQIPADLAVFEYETAGYKTKVVLLKANIQKSDSVTALDSYDALILYSRKSER